MSNNSFSYNTYNEITPYYKRLSSSIKLSKHGKNLLNVDFTNPNDKLNSPRSQIALLNLGIDMNCLYYLSRDEYLSKHPELKNESIDVKNRYYYHFEEKRKNKIKRAIKKRDELISSSPSSPKNYSTDNINLIDPSAIKREQEQLDLMKKQNLCEIKNLIDFEININKRRSANEHKLLLQQEREYKRKESKEKERQEKVKEEKILNDKRNEQIRQDQIKQIKEYKEYFLNQIKEFKKEKEKVLQKQKQNLKRQLEAQQKDQAFRDKLEQNYQNHRKALEDKQRMLEKKNEERRKKIEMKKLSTSQKLKEEQYERERKSANARRKKEEMIKSKYDKYLQKQEIIQQLKKEQMRRKQMQIKKMQKLRNEKEIKNEETRNRNNERLEQRKQILLKHFEINNEKINNQKKRNKECLNNRLIENQIRTLDKNEKLKETEDQMKYRNYLKLVEIEHKQKRAGEILRRKETMALKKLRLQEEMKLRKDDLLNKVNKLLATGKYTEKEDIYQMVFNKDDMSILNISDIKSKNDFHRTKSGNKMNHSKSQCNLYNDNSLFITHEQEYLDKKYITKPQTPFHSVNQSYISNKK